MFKIMQKIKEKITTTQFFVNYKRMWPYIRPYWFRALMAVLICIPIGSLDAIIALSLKPYMDLVMVEKSIASPWYIPFGNRRFYLYSRRSKLSCYIFKHLGWWQNFKRFKI